MYWKPWLTSHLNHADFEYMPVNVRAEDDYLGAIWCRVAVMAGRNLAHYLPFDVREDGFPYPDRACCGLPYMPRAHILDFRPNISEPFPSPFSEGNEKE
jgi:hypothetical protein